MLLLWMLVWMKLDEAKLEAEQGKVEDVALVNGHPKIKSKIENISQIFTAYIEIIYRPKIKLTK